MAARSLVWLVLALAAALVTAGCIGPSSPPGGDPGAPGEDDGDEAGPGPFFGFTPGVSSLPLPEGSAGLTEGYVFDVADGAPVERATVLATCVRQGLPALDATTPESFVAFTTPDGHFVMTGLDGFGACQSIEYTVQAAGYTMTVPLSSGPVTAGTQYLVHAGMTPAG